MHTKAIKKKYYLKKQQQQFTLVNKQAYYVSLPTPDAVNEVLLVRRNIQILDNRV